MVVGGFVSELTRSTRRLKCVELDGVEFNEKFNDDIFWMVISYLEIGDLKKLEQVSKYLRISQLSVEDSPQWSQYYQKQIENQENLMRYTYYYSGREINQFLLNYKQKETDFKKNLCLLYSEIEKCSDINFKKRSTEIEKSKIGTNIYKPKNEVLSTNILPKKDESIKLVVVGNGSVGKTCLLYRLDTNQFPMEYVPTIMDNHYERYDFKGHWFEIHYWDISTNDDYPRLRTLSYPETDVFLVVFSCVYERSLSDVLDVWIPEIRHHCPEAANILVCSKIDLRDDEKEKRQYMRRYLNYPISKEEGEKVAINSGCLTYLEVSSLKDIGIRDLREILVGAHCINNLHEKKKNKCLLQ